MKICRLERNSFSIWRILSDDRVLHDPTLLLQTRCLTDSELRKCRYLALSNVFTLLTRRGRFIVNNLVRSIYRSEQLLKDSDKSEADDTNSASIQTSFGNGNRGAGVERKRDRTERK